ncbi:MAG: hypothetical protein KDH09_04215, partial [Chrysiogenetes bacterium]|nr:hypothetical protein [Chrysiogenetes bacterium]
MKNRILSTLAIVALICGTAASCSDDDAAGLTAQGVLASLASKDGNLGFVSGVAGFVPGVAPASVEVEDLSPTEGEGDDTITVQAIAYNINVSAEVEGAAKTTGEPEGGNIGILVMFRGNDILYVTGGNLEPGSGNEPHDIDGTPYAVLIENLAEYDGPEGDATGFFLAGLGGEGDEDSWIYDGDSTEPTEVVDRDIVTACPPNSPAGTWTGTGLTYSVFATTATAEGIEFEIGLDEQNLMETGEGITGHRVLVTPMGGVDVPVVNVDISYTFDCEFTPAEIARRRLRNVCLAYLVDTGEQDWI